MSETFDSPCKCRYLKSSQKCRFHLDGRIFSFCIGTCSDVFLAGKYQIRWKSQENFRYFGLERPNWNCFFFIISDYLKVTPLPKCAMWSMMIRWAVALLYTWPTLSSLTEPSSLFQSWMVITCSLFIWNRLEFYDN